MDITYECLRQCKVENLERLAVALGGRVPKHKPILQSVYARELAREVLRRLHRDATESAIAARSN